MVTRGGHLLGAHGVLGDGCALGPYSPGRLSGHLTTGKGLSAADGQPYRQAAGASVSQYTDL